MGFLGDIFGGGMFGGFMGGGGGGGGASAGGGLVDLSTASNAQTSNLTATETAADSYNQTSNLAHNISGSANTYNVYKIGSGEDGGLADDFGLPLTDQLTPMPGSARPSDKKKTLYLIAGLALLAGLVWWWFKRK